MWKELINEKEFTLTNIKPGDYFVVRRDSSKKDWTYEPTEDYYTVPKRLERVKEGAMGIEFDGWVMDLDFLNKHFRRVPKRFIEIEV